MARTDIRHIDLRDRALLAILAAYTKDHPYARMDVFKPLIDDAIEADPHSDPIALALSVAGAVEAEAGTLAGYIKFAIQQAGPRAALAGLDGFGDHNLDRSARATINENLRRLGFDGNGRWDSIGKAIMALNEALEPFSMHIPMITADTFRQRPGGQVGLPVIDSRDGIDFTNTVMAFGYHDHGSEYRAFEIVAYLS